jgi:hypothetical protein
MFVRRKIARKNIDCDCAFEWLQYEIVNIITSNKHLETLKLQSSFDVWYGGRVFLPHGLHWTRDTNVRIDSIQFANTSAVFSARHSRFVFIVFTWICIFFFFLECLTRCFPSYKHVSSTPRCNYEIFFGAFFAFLADFIIFKTSLMFLMHFFNLLRHFWPISCNMSKKKKLTYWTKNCTT